MNRIAREIILHTCHSNEWKHICSHPSDLPRNFKPLRNIFSNSGEFSGLMGSLSSFLSLFRIIMSFFGGILLVVPLTFVLCRIVFGFKVVRVIFQQLRYAYERPLDEGQAQSASVRV